MTTLTIQECRTILRDFNNDGTLITPDHFHKKYSFSALVEFFNNLGEHVSDESGKINKDHRQAFEHESEWYIQAGKYIRIHYLKGVKSAKTQE